jgi:FkbM family methyltransferase
MTLLEICKKAKIPFDTNNKIIIPSWVKHIKFDIGLSYSAPNSQTWIVHQPDTLVFGFEPNPSSVQRILSPNNYKNDVSHGEVLDFAFVNYNFFLIPVALSNTSAESLPFYVTHIDEGCSSLLKPKEYCIPIKEIISVPVFTLEDFFSLLPLDSIDYIEYIKIDVQGMDLNVIKGAGKYLTEKVVYVTAECESNQYETTFNNTPEYLTEYMNSIGFSAIQHPNCSDPTFINNKFKNSGNNIFISQQG